MRVHSAGLEVILPLCIKKITDSPPSSAGLGQNMKNNNNMMVRYLTHTHTHTPCTPYLLYTSWSGGFRIVILNIKYYWIIAINLIIPNITRVILVR